MEFYYVDKNLCIECGCCVDICPVGAIDNSNGIHFNNDLCVRCGSCESACPNNAILYGDGSFPEKEEEKKEKEETPKQEDQPKEETLVYLIDEGTCVSCGSCESSCPNQAIHLNDNGYYFIDTNECMSCGLCKENCPVEAISLTKK